ncbi:MAG: histidinol-phosphate transaminase [Clostridia bacterium]|nr:histidinol-phosphate transaminase [Clostridia bacterium]
MTHESAFRPAVFKLFDYIAGKTIEEVKRELGLDNIVKLASNENPFGPSPRALKAVTEELTNINMYPEKSFLDLKKILAEYNGVSPKNIVVGHGSETIIQLIPQLYLNPGEEVITADKTYGRYEEASKLMDGIIKYVPLKDYRYDLQGIMDMISPRTKIIWLCNPNNPTGTIVKRYEVEAFLGNIPEKIAVVFDQAYFEYVDDPDYANGLDYVKESYENVIVLRTFSKAHGLAGLRLGYGIAHERICQMLDRIKEPFNLNRLSIAAGPASLSDEQWLSKCVTENKMGREYLFKELTALGCHVVASQTNFILFDVKEDCDMLFKRLLARGVIIRPASAWGLDTFIRVTVGTMQENKRFIETLKEEL